MDMETPGKTADRTDFVTLPTVERTGFVELSPYEGEIDPREWEGLEYLDWKSGGDTNFAILASATGEHDPRGFWEHGKPDKDGVWTSNIEASPTLRKWTESVGANFGRVRIIKLEPNSEADALRNLHPDDNNRITEKGTGWVVRAWLQLTDNPNSFMIVRESKDDPATEHRIPLPAGAQFVLDSERLHHAVWHQGIEPRYALIASFESGPELGSWIESQRKV
jgi:hypothetical protein